MDKNIFFKFKIRFVLLEQTRFLSMRESEFQISISVESYDEKTAENYGNCYIAEKRIVSKLSTISIQNFDSTNRKLQ